MDALNNALQIEPNDPNLLLSRGAMLVELGSLNEAFDAIQKSLSFDSTIDDSWYYKGVIHYRKKEYEESLDAFKEANKLNPVNARNLVHMGIVFSNLGMTDKGRESCQLAKKIDPIYTEHLLQGLLGIVKGNVEQANSGFNEATKRLIEKHKENEELS